MSLLERRRSPRFPFHTSAHIVIGNIEHNGTVVDLSASGVLIRAAEELDCRLGEPCELNLLIGNLPGQVIFRGVVVSQRRQLLGIEFRNVEVAARLALEKVIEMNLGVPQLLDRDMPALLRQLHDCEAMKAGVI
ncbi:PilZ domain-containing protein [Dechloromonas sp. HYN0024]|uniref:PilZ domain-containing protein n=1 Tax=Dechloromonas sp. HYN0024 TaxID=2231055 RepID=UPI0013C2B02C|nr:PilZ domain-containing protein [Dechloromonas sp. HYN0024]